MSASQRSKGLDKPRNYERIRTRSEAIQGAPAVAVRPVSLKTPYEHVVGYSASADGRVWSHKSSHWLRPSITPNGYLVVGLSVGGRKARLFFVHRLVVDAWLPIDLTRLRINHKDGDKHNNDLSNLERCTSAENNLHAISTGLRRNGSAKGQPARKLTEEAVRMCRSSKATKTSLAKQYGVTISAITNAILCKTWKHVV